MSYIGIDIGTTGSKAVAFDDSGKILAEASREYPIKSPWNGWFELESGEVITLCKTIIAKVAAEIRYGDPVRAIGIASQGETFTLLDKHDNYLSNAMVSSDGRSSPQVEEICRKFGKEKLYRITGHSAHTLFSLFKLQWIKENQPEVLEKTKRLLCFGDLLRYELTGQAMISYNLAARTMFFDVSEKRWSDEILDEVGVSSEILSVPVEAGCSAGPVKATIAEELGLPKDTIVATGGHDQCCGSIGVGVTGPGMAAYSIGTVECITPAFEECVLDKTMMNSNLATYPYTLPDLYTTVAFCITGGSGLKWFIDNLCKCEKNRAVEYGENVYRQMLGAMPSEPTNLFVLPHFSSTGTPYFDPSPLGAILGMNLNTTKTELLKGLLEGITYEMKLNLELLSHSGIDLRDLRAFGGGVRSEVWMQIKADILGIPITCFEVREAGCMGAAMLAAKAAEDVDSVNDCCEKWVKFLKVYEPDESRKVLYQQRYEVYKGLYDVLKPVKDKANNLK